MVENPPGPQGRLGIYSYYCPSHYSSDSHCYDFSAA